MQFDTTAKKRKEKEKKEAVHQCDVWLSSCEDPHRGDGAQCQSFDSPTALKHPFEYDRHSKSHDYTEKKTCSAWQAILNVITERYRLLRAFCLKLLLQVSIELH